MAPALFIGGLGIALALVVWLASSLKTTPPGYTRIGSFKQFEASAVERILQRAAIPTLVDNHSGMDSGGRRDFSLVHVYVPTGDAASAVALPKKDRAAC